MVYRPDCVINPEIVYNTDQRRRLAQHLEEDIDRPATSTEIRNVDLTGDLVGDAGSSSSCAAVAPADCAPLRTARRAAIGGVVQSAE